MDVALGVFPGEDQRSAIFRLARELTANDLHTTENIAINVGHGDALDFARKRLVIRKSAPV